MKKQNIMGERLKRLREEKGLTLAEMEKLSGIGASTISNYENGIRTPRPSILESLMDFFNVDPGYLMGTQDVKRVVDLTGTYNAGVEHGKKQAIKEIKTLNVMSNVINVPIYSSLSCGTGTWVDEIPEDFISIPESMMFHGQAFANFAEGDSMEPNIKSGDLLVFQECPQIQSGYIGSFSLNDAYYCKRFKQLPDGSYWLFSDNSNYDPIPITKNDDFRVLGIYKLKISKEQ